MADLSTDRRDQPSASPAPSVGTYDSFATEEERAAHLKRVLRKQTARRAWRMRDFYILLAPAVVLLFVFKYIPMYGISIAFVDYNIVRGVLGSTWNNFKWFDWVFNDPFFWRVLRNTVILAVLRTIFSFPAPIILALLLNEVRVTPYKRTVQSVSYLPHFLSWIVLSGIVRELLSMQSGAIPYLMERVGLEPFSVLTTPETFRALIMIVTIWQSVGWGTIIFLAALSGVDPQLYESAAIDGTNRWQNVIHITIPALVPVITILFLLSVGNILEFGFDPIFNLYNSNVYEKVDVFETLVYRSGIEGARYSYATAVQLFQNAVGLVVLVGANQIVRRYSEYGVW
jgi:putative aldouronate transport system permease protein